MRVLLHPGFHKTGTTTLQRGARSHAASLDPQMRMLFAEDLHDAVIRARQYSDHPKKQRLANFTEAFARGIGPVDTTDPRPLLISCEALVGRLPGRTPTVIAYDAAPDLITAATGVLKDHFGPDLDLQVTFTTREGNSWLRSVYWQNLRVMRLTDDFETYRARHERAMDLDAIVTQTRSALSGKADVTEIAIETCLSLPLGPLGPMLAMLDIPTSGLAPIPSSNIQPPGAAEDLLALNRSSLDDDALQIAKRELHDKYQREGRLTRPAKGLIYDQRIHHWCWPDGRPGDVEHLDSPSCLVCD